MAGEQRLEQLVATHFRQWVARGTIGHFEQFYHTHAHQNLFRLQPEYLSNSLQGSATLDQLRLGRCLALESRRSRRSWSRVALPCRECNSGPTSPGAMSCSRKSSIRAALPSS